MCCVKDLSGWWMLYRDFTFSESGFCTFSYISRPGTASCSCWLIVVDGAADMQIVHDSGAKTKGLFVLSAFTLFCLCAHDYLCWHWDLEAALNLPAFIVVLFMPLLSLSSPSTAFTASPASSFVSCLKWLIWCGWICIIAGIAPAGNDRQSQG